MVPGLDHLPSTTLRRNQKLGKPTRPTRGLNVQAHPKGRPRRRPTAQANAAISSTKGPVPPSLTIRRWKTPWTVHKSLLTEQPDLRSGTGQPVAEDRSALRPLPQIKLDCPPLPAPGYRRRTGNPVLLRGELTLDFPLPASAYGGQRSQPSLEPMTDDGPVRPTILPGLGGGGAPSPRSRDDSKPALSKNREPNPASVFHRQPKTQQTERKPKPHNRRWNIRLWRTEEKAGVSLTYRTSTAPCAADPPSLSFIHDEIRRHHRRNSTSASHAYSVTSRRRKRLNLEFNQYSCLLMQNNQKSPASRTVTRVLRRNSVL